MSNLKSGYQVTYLPKLSQEEIMDERLSDPANLQLWSTALSTAILNIQNDQKSSDNNQYRKKK